MPEAYAGRWPNFRHILLEDAKDRVDKTEGIQRTYYCARLSLPSEAEESAFVFAPGS
jgi:hypothetical protein